jgi:general stress protein YciG
MSQHRGFGAMPKQKVQEIGSKGGQARATHAHDDAPVSHRTAHVSTKVALTITANLKV